MVDQYPLMLFAPDKQLTERRLSDDMRHGRREFAVATEYAVDHRRIVLWQAELTLSA